MLELFVIPGIATGYALVAAMAMSARRMSNLSELVSLQAAACHRKAVSM